MMLPPDPSCPMTRQIQTAEELGAAVLVIVVEEAGPAVLTAAILATTSLFSRNKLNNKIPTASSEARGEVGETERDPGEALNGEQRGRGGPVHHEEERGSVRKDGDIPAAMTRHNLNGKFLDTELSAAGTCPPLTVVVGHDEGSLILEWIRNAQGGGKNNRVENGDRRLRVHLVEQADVGRLWGDVVWAEDPRNWPKGRQAYMRVH